MRRADWIEFAKYAVQRQMILNTAINPVFYNKRRECLYQLNNYNILSKYKVQGSYKSGYGLLKRPLKVWER